MLCKSITPPTHEACDLKTHKDKVLRYRKNSPHIAQKTDLAIGPTESQIRRKARPSN